MGLTRVAVLLCLSGNTTGVQSINSESVCKREYEEKKSVWRALSGATVVYTPMGHQPKWYWKEVMRRNGMEITEMPSGYEDLWLQQLHGSAQSQVLGCQIHEGRYWALNIDVPKLYKAMAKGSRNAFLRRFSVHFGFVERPEYLPVNWRDTACFPASCNEQVLVNEIFEESFARPLMGPNAARKLGNATFQDVVQIQELADWSSIKIDFAIGGVDKCGTTSLHRNLNEHPEIVFSTFGEDFFFTADIVHRLLPLRSQVDSYNAQLERAKEEKERQGFRPRLVGTFNPVLFKLGLARLKLAAIPQLKMIMIFCDPVDRMEKHFMEYHYCFDHVDPDEAKRRGLVADRHPNQTCFESTTSILSEQEGELSEFWLERSVADHVPAMTSFFSGRIAFAHQEQLRENSEQVLTSLAQFLGVEHSFQTRHFPRYNSVGGNRTDLCHNQSLVRELQKHLEPEYLMQEAILQHTGQSIPEGLRKRITRCDRSEAAPSCPHATVCTDDVATDGQTT